jgi:hypothetical protein
VDRLTALRAAVAFNARVGRPPRRRDFRRPDLDRWQQVLDMPLPSEDQVKTLFGGFIPYLEHAGLPRATRRDFADIEAAALKVAQKAYPDLELIRAEANHFDGFVLGSEKVEVKGSHLQLRYIDGVPTYFFSFKLHRRPFATTIDRLLCVGVGTHAERGTLELLALFDFPKGALPLVSGKDAVQMTDRTIWGASIGSYTPYLTKRRPVSSDELATWVRPNKRPVEGEHDDET